ncbi:hypothetical protein GLOTRDRAFT_137596 [Gloeophyllum trabeum ATCC 11539]|uniref:DNA topoisomerase I n=1 Tax=Gloeophyllum trabeum (strain ATCC 11539 / FP-39264 / Madison 617) TaxID=670483 RepID=S7QCY2_GLOTA|nr:uncharacterized protein GLOTRDRAFT_137596 [Gloeophyllum trabeum ATCC 11539]EPQ57212.1 hypothetical protein GLOTRDRAFT_137596 [Gloeophyllum trabeum ATCC 11539]
MSSVSDALSDDDRPLAATPAKNGNGHAVNGNGRSNGAKDSSPMSEDDDLPLSQATRTKSEPATPNIRSLKRKQPVFSDSSDDDVPLASSPTKSAAVPMPGAHDATTVKASAATNGKAHGAKSKKEIPSDSDDDEPLTAKKGAANGKARQPPKKKVKQESEDGAYDDSEDDRPIQKEKAPPRAKRKTKVESDVGYSSEEEKPAKKKPVTKKTAAKKIKDDEGDEGASGSEPPKAKKRMTKAKAKKEDSEPPAKKGRGKKKEETEEPEDVYKWWEIGANNDGSEKWQTLEHNGVFFPPPYEPLPSHVKMKYNGQDVDLPPESEEVATFYAKLLETDHARDETFNKNFFEDWLKVLKKHPPRDGTKITDFSRCDFRPMYEYFEAEKAKQKALTAAEKKELREAKAKAEEKYATCLLDGRKEKVGNFRVEPPGLFRGRGEHPKKGCLKFRVRPEDITINIGENAPVPVPNMPGNWKAVIHDKTVTWLACWTENINGNYKYVFLAAGSSLKGQSDMIKFEKARELKNHVDRIRRDYTEHLRNKVMADRQRATAMYFIDRLALRAGNEKGEDEADTVGCCSLRCEHVTLEQPNFLIFDFLGKDSIRYYNRVPVDQQVFKNIRIFKQDKEDHDDLFDRVTTSSLNKHLQNYMKGLTAKVFRTYNASITFQQQLDQGTPEKGTVQEKLNAYNHANRMVAILCNHQRSVPKTHEQSMEKMRDKIRGFKYERRKLRHVLFNMDPKYKKKKDYAEDESDLEDEWMYEHEGRLKAKEIEKAEKKFAKDNEKLQEEGVKPQPESVLKERIKEIEAEFKQLRKERETGKVKLKRDRPAEKVEEAIQKLDEKIKTSKLQMVDREAGKEVALGTSKINYLDPRITAAWCKVHDVPIEKIFSKTLLNKFPWAMEVDEDWKF